MLPEAGFVRPRLDITAAEVSPSNLLLNMAPDHLAAAGQALADHPSVHGAFARSGPGS
ncbi:hypothetical protein HEK616_80960 (plasmid) [Streptomyces nigrescens]|uniref:Uncharacterized protein n=1 Tax=Streptomyces nigrescens TaxID=1920 RepID=A0ABN6R8A4_STRNI|nr:hypothetical protein HEK616_80960 [Streptomyces nigrescens]